VNAISLKSSTDRFGQLPSPKVMKTSTAGSAASSSRCGVRMRGGDVGIALEERADMRAEPEREARRAADDEGTADGMIAGRRRGVAD
jgi:hypothetical protein